MFIDPTRLLVGASPDLLRILLRAGGPLAKGAIAFLEDPVGTLARAGEIVFWSGPNGNKVIGGLETLVDSQQRIEGAVAGIETAQLTMNGVLGVVESVSVASIGLTSLTGALMAYRLQAINRRIDSLGKSIKDVEGKIDAQNKAHLKASLQSLREYDDSPTDPGMLRKSLDRARDAANIYSTLALDEAVGPARLPVLNCRSRLFIVSLLTELRCLMSLDDPRQAIQRIEDEQVTLRHVAESCFNQTLKADPERFMRAAFQTHGVSLGFLANIYQQAKQLGIVDQPATTDAEGVFEYVRQKLERGEGFRDKWRRLGVTVELQKLRYLAACLEDTGRIYGLELLIGHHKDKASLAELIIKLKEWRVRQAEQERDGDAPPLFAYAF